MGRLNRTGRVALVSALLFGGACYETLEPCTFSEEQVDSLALGEPPYFLYAETIEATSNGRRTEESSCGEDVPVAIVSCRDSIEDVFDAVRRARLPRCTEWRFFLIGSLAASCPFDDLVIDEGNRLYLDGRERFFVIESCTIIEAEDRPTWVLVF